MSINGGSSKPLLEKPNPSEDSSDRRTRLAENNVDTCCCCIPITTSITFICILSALIVLFYLVFTIILFFDAHLPWWYPFVNLVFVLGLGLTALILMLTYSCGKDTRGTRKNVAVAQILVLILIVVLSIWNIIYINEFYHEKKILLGYGSDNDEGVHEESNWEIEKRDFVLWNFCNGCFWAGWFFYFWYITDVYADLKSSKE